MKVGSIITGITEFNSTNENHFSVYPNPNNGTFTITSTLWHMCETNEISLEIFNSLGQQIYSQQIKSTNGEINETIDLNNITSGIYFVRVRDGNNYAEQKLIIEK